MQITHKAGLALASLGLLSLAALPAAAQNLVVNPGFETGDFTGYTLGGNNNPNNILVATVYVTTAPVVFNPHSGTKFAVLGPIGSDGTLSQTLATTAGDQYQVGFYLASDGATPNDFSASFGGTTLFSQTNIPATTGYVNHTFTVTGTGAPEILLFSFRNDPGVLALDDISVTAANPVPEASTTVSLGLLLCLGLGGLAFSAQRRKANAAE